jgi:hypothetical protein
VTIGTGLDPRVIVKAMPQPGIGRFDFGEPMFGTACLVGVETVQIQNVRGTDGL